MATFESMDRRMPKIEACLKANGLESLDACNEMLLAKGIDCDKIVRGVQPICFDNAVWAYTQCIHQPYQYFIITCHIPQYQSSIWTKTSLHTVKKRLWIRIMMETHRTSNCVK